MFGCHPRGVGRGEHFPQSALRRGWRSAKARREEGFCHRSKLRGVGVYRGLGGGEGTQVLFCRQFRHRSWRGWLSSQDSKGEGDPGAAQTGQPTCTGRFGIRKVQYQIGQYLIGSGRFNIQYDGIGI